MCLAHSRARSYWKLRSLTVLQPIIYMHGAVEANIEKEYEVEEKEEDEEEDTRTRQWRAGETGIFTGRDG